MKETNTLCTSCSHIAQQVYILPGQWKLLDVVDADYLSDAEATEML